MEKSRRDIIASLFLEVSTVEEMSTLLDEVLTNSELEALSLRITLVRKLLQGVTQRHIATEHHISLCKITRGSKIIKNQNSVIKKILEKRMENGIED